MRNGLDAFLQAEAVAAPRGVRIRRRMVEAGSTPATAGHSRLRRGREVCHKTVSYRNQVLISTLDGTEPLTAKFGLLKPVS
jgi:hypothetical protein